MTTKKSIDELANDYEDGKFRKLKEDVLATLSNPEPSVGVYQDTLIIATPSERQRDTFASELRKSGKYIVMTADHGGHTIYQVLIIPRAKD